jgi:hypothetical protein
MEKRKARRRGTLGRAAEGKNREALGEGEIPPGRTERADKPDKEWNSLHHGVRGMWRRLVGRASRYCVISEISTLYFILFGNL